MKERQIQSITIVNHNNKGYSATLLFTNSELNKCISAPTHEEIYKAIDWYVFKVVK